MRLSLRVVYTLSPMVSNHSQYRSYLKAVLAERQRSNHAYSMRAFARNLGLTQSGVSQVLSGKKNLSQESAHQIAEKLGLNDRDTEFFCLLVQLETAKTAILKESILKKLNSLNPKEPVEVLSLEFFRAISDWYHLVIKNMTDIEGLELTPKAIAKRLGITSIEADSALERLLKLELIEPIEGRPHRYRQVKNYVIAKAATPNEALRNFHRQMLEKAKDSLTTQTPQEKIIGSETFAFNERHLKEADQITEEYFKKMAALAKGPGKKTQVYHLGVQFFNVTKEKS